MSHEKTTEDPLETCKKAMQEIQSTATVGYIGTPFLVVFTNILGAFPASERPYSVLVAQKKYPLPAEKADVNKRAFTICGRTGMPDSPSPHSTLLTHFSISQPSINLTDGTSAVEISA